MMFKAVDHISVSGIPAAVHRDPVLLPALPPNSRGLQAAEGVRHFKISGSTSCPFLPCPINEYGAPCTEKSLNFCNNDFYIISFMNDSLWPPMNTIMNTNMKAR